MKKISKLSSSSGVRLGQVTKGASEIGIRSHCKSPVIKTLPQIGAKAVLQLLQHYFYLINRNLRVDLQVTPGQPGLSLDVKFASLTAKHVVQPSSLWLDLHTAVIHDSHCAIKLVNGRPKRNITVNARYSHDAAFPTVPTSSETWLLAYSLILRYRPSSVYKSNKC